jgi:hypothetical protein
LVEDGSEGFAENQTDVLDIVLDVGVVDDWTDVFCHVLVGEVGEEDFDCFQEYLAVEVTGCF